MIWTLDADGFGETSAGAGASNSGKTSATKETPKIDLLWGQKVPMRDGVNLNATVFKPHDQKTPLPAVFTFTPYVSDTYQERATYFAKNGYAFALVDVRGRGNSGGAFEPFMNDGRDGHDVVEWLAKQPWCDGKVAMWGGSHAGFNQWSTLKEFPAHLSTIVPAAAAHMGVDFPFYKNIFGPYMIQWLTFTSGVTGNANLFNLSEYWISKFSELFVSHAPFKDLGLIAGNASGILQKWIEHPTSDEYWDSAIPTEEDYRRMSVPILTITGHYDGDQPGAMTFYRNHMKYGSPEAKKQHYIIIGPWDHPGTRTPKREFGGMAFGESSVLDMNDLHRQWYDWTMKKGEKPGFLKNRVAYYVPGAEVWKYADDLESIPTGTMKLFLDSSNGHTGDAFHSGTLSEKEPSGSAPDAFTYDPLDTRPASVYKKDYFPTFITDQRNALNLFGNGLVYHTEPFEAEMELTGFAKLSAWVEMDVPDTDFSAEVCEIREDGTSVLLTQDFMRARYRNSLRREELVKPGEVNRYLFDWFTFFSRQVAKNSRLRLTFNCINNIYFEKNYNSGGVVAEESGKDARTAHVKLYHDKARPSCLEIPTVKAQAQA